MVVIVFCGHRRLFQLFTTSSSNFTENLISFTDHATSPARGGRGTGSRFRGHMQPAYTHVVLWRRTRVRRADVCSVTSSSRSRRGPVSHVARQFAHRCPFHSRVYVCHASCSSCSPLLSSPLQALLRAPPGSLTGSHAFGITPATSNPASTAAPLDARARGAHPSARRRGRVPIHTCRHARASQPALARGRVPGARAGGACRGRVP
jgi:hypothetical protein